MSLKIQLSKNLMVRPEIIKTGTSTVNKASNFTKNLEQASDACVNRDHKKRHMNEYKSRAAAMILEFICRTPKIVGNIFGKRWARRPNKETKKKMASKTRKTMACLLETSSFFSMSSNS